MRHLATILITLLLAVPAMSVELFRYRGATKDGGTLEYVFEAGEQNSPNAITKEKAAEIAADFMTTFYHVQVGALGNVLCPKWRNVSSQMAQCGTRRKIGLSIIREATRSSSEVLDQMVLVLNNDGLTGNDYGSRLSVLSSSHSNKSFA